MNEAQIRFNKIDLKLRGAGWGIDPGTEMYDKLLFTGTYRKNISE